MSEEKIKVKKIKCSFLSNAKGFAISENFIVTFTGTRANIFDKQLRPIKSIINLKYVYHGYISPDEKNILLVSSTNIFYVFSLDTFECLKKHSFRGRFNYNLEGRGAWNFDGKTFLICACDKYSLHSCIMYFSLEEKKPIKQIELPQYSFQSICKIEESKKFLFVGRNNEDEHKNYLFYISEDIYEEYPIANFDEAILNVEYNCILDCLIIYGCNYSIFCGKKGEFIKPIETRKIIKKYIKSLSDWLKELNFNIQEKEEMLDKIFDFIGKENQDEFENINKLLLSDNLQLIYGATSERFFIYSKKQNQIIYSKRIPFGVYDIVQLYDNKLLLSTWNGTLLYSIIYYTNQS